MSLAPWRCPHALRPDDARMPLASRRCPHASRAPAMPACLSRPGDACMPLAPGDARMPLAPWRCPTTHRHAFLKVLTERRLTGLTLEVAKLRKPDKETKDLLFAKSQEALRLYARNNDLRLSVKDLKKELGGKDKAMAQVAEELGQRNEDLAQWDVELTKLREEMGQLKEEMARKEELYQKSNDDLTNEATEAYGAGFGDGIAQVACVHPGVDLS
ncbi:hypothetical protein VNO80_31206 [Phaseolus coccineus]|uniref:Uncharacterized protein n=1 Tax=Phaseolus coccineus TaxID=3886 RepID=A0AAN9L977_PHACN